MQNKYIKLYTLRKFPHSRGPPYFPSSETLSLLNPMELISQKNVD